MPGKDPGGIVVTTLISIVGDVLGGFIGTMLGIGSVSGFNIKSFLIAIAVALVLLYLYRRVKKKA